MTGRAHGCRWPGLRLPDNRDAPLRHPGGPALWAERLVDLAVADAVRDALGGKVMWAIVKDWQTAGGDGD